MDYVTIGCMVCIIILLLHRIDVDTKTREKLFNIQIEMAQAQQAMTKELSWSELKKIIDEIMQATCTNYITVNGLRNMKDEQITLIWTAILNDISSSVELSLSNELKRQILKNVTLSYLTKYIKDGVQIFLVYDLEKNRNNSVNLKIEQFRSGKIQNPEYKQKTK